MTLHVTVQRIGDKTSRKTVTQFEYKTYMRGFAKNPRGGRGVETGLVEVTSGPCATIAEALAVMERKFKALVESDYLPGEWRHSIWEHHL